MLIPSVIILLAVIGLGAQHSVFAQSEEWKTYINPEYKFTIEYPFKTDSLSGYINYNKSSDMLDSDITFGLYIYPSYGVKDIKHFVESALANDTDSTTINWTVFEDIKPVKYANLTGYGFKTYDKNDSIMTDIILLHNDIIMRFETSNSITDYTVDKFIKMINSIKFFN
ncbi:hypothetical protein [Candidatus Nitrosocosmicus sp. SS]|jgi:hypothetical protein|uniref:hypothetical protein n=1 Tax=Candidatus Nitrosocosmicus agrestis TaxID=2563600 RepID=UPI00122E5F3B|nr:hypothetical protein [Candidatus Nitrosocosmicus sp. SS]KAA2279383.1 hypothetical protein F1Z66_13415 [Candidatus Nitrosocosmicus sp. SS]KAF0868071.1 hypothetical protein E5N71_11960 [Candidatus Nitrosocosmicus sp. SS]